MHEYTRYFKSKDGFDRFIKGLYSKYQSLSKFSGVVKLDNLTEDEVSALSRLFGEFYNVGDSVNFSIKKFMKVMQNSKFEDFDIGVLVEEYLGVSLVTNKEKKEMWIEEEEAFYANIIQKNSLGSIWLKEVVTNKIVPYKLILQRYHKNKKELNKELVNIISLIDHLPEKRVLLPIYASFYTKDPHYLDIDSSHSTLFFYALSYIDKGEFPKSREDKIMLLSKYHIEIDNLSNYVITYNLLSNKEYINGFAKNRESLLLNIQNIMTTKWFNSKGGKVFIFENPSILTEVLMKNLDVTVVVSGGFINLSVYLLLDKLVDSGSKLYYNGDFDPEGLLIAQKLKEKYQDKLELICYDEMDYQNCISKKKISSVRLSKLSKVNVDELFGIKELLVSEKYSAYQENNKDRIIDVISDIVKELK
ncbi:MAG: DUF2399 domain-containing protein [Bacilli bacterium]|nr:DUF2399 domain-containing protein [Bacilli bacterium]